MSTGSLQHAIAWLIKKKKISLQFMAYKVNK